MSYKHPDKYRGVYGELFQIRARAQVEINCLRCDLFNGIDHDFSECNRKYWSDECTCPLECRQHFSLVQPTIHIRYSTISGITPQEMEKIYGRYYDD